MLIMEVAGTDTNAQKIFVLSKLLTGQNSDTGAKNEMTLTAFLDAARDAGAPITAEQLGELISDPNGSLKEVLEPLQPNEGVVRFKGNIPIAQGMSVNQARDTVDRNAKAALKRRA
ncbi:hypothetical protein UFOVP1146_93 [uncultured Caudovirales phage]|uniref:Uncharacterized protein n=1 Tax=uncultured Caudovirales phage TaxID=2100421 RepID=A0A6J5SZ52_9CAUD|nr:hypothetical protein UFOVP812_6 [uncultured Caudovirales phage]CAB4165602.1 hypothetical protein UFOVP818_138 [uncultured Caudovirales phage]CAB4186747.1 hypothetical protein UFOVP1146_93 [uncultured Caudovirales phage]CAB4220738.1 hypothetical protein UFOVP1638_51 [uncultured Caudovirales phage]